MKRTGLLLALMMVVVGCGSGGDPAQPGADGTAAGAASTPQELLAAMTKSMETFDVPTYVSCFKVNADGKRVLLEEMAAMKVTEEFAEKLATAYGKSGAELFGSDRLATVVSQIRSATVRVTGDTAVAEFPDGKDTIKMAKADGGWLIVDDRYAAAAKQSADKEIKETASLRKAMELVLPEVGKSGVGLQTIIDKLGRAIQEFDK